MCFFDKDTKARVRLPAVFFIYLHSKDVNSFSCLLALVTPARFIFIVRAAHRDYRQSTPHASGFHSATSRRLDSQKLNSCEVKHDFRVNKSGERRAE